MVASKQKAATHLKELELSKQRLVSKSVIKREKLNSGIQTVTGAKNFQIFPKDYLSITLSENLVGIRFAVAENQRIEYAHRIQVLGSPKSWL